LKQLLKIQLPQQALTAFCQHWKIKEMSFFGSVLREDFRPDSDIDVLVSFEEDAEWGLLEFVRMQRELKALLGREVDLLTKKSIGSMSPFCREK
jgi:hypothetical protein